MERRNQGIPPTTQSKEGNPLGTLGDFGIQTGHIPSTSLLTASRDAPEFRRKLADRTCRISQAIASIPAQGPGSVVFEEGNILERLAYPDESFDVVYSSQVFGHLPPPDMPLRALAEIRRVLKPGGILATRDGVEQHFYPRRLDLDRLWARNLSRALHKGEPDADPTESRMPALFREAGFDADGGKVCVGGGATVYSGPQTRQWLAWRASGQLKEGDPFRQSWLDAGITEDEIQQTLFAVGKWAETEDAWFASPECEMLAWK
ncbi:S-adenosyl-L-methionine-dependent methyltransferase [Diplogelasinospora grovesii]|uniref:S-adenosyl-L-methionine-dependent methyltransferase n=1 Tax=Diplogelasinospora grovesii TaxID=303347 RepID=A0AAN6MZN3_9PEZI|nr:S-adenosyl-L-methionine-dependent methyltransferase [Diplogelasinospora grovesii]